MLWTWQNGDISANEIYGGDFVKASARSRPRPTSCPERPTSFPVADSKNEVAHMPNATLILIPSVWATSAGGPQTNPTDVVFLDAAFKELLAS